MTNTQAEELLKALIEIPSMSGQESEVLFFLESLLQNAGFEIQRIPVRKDTFCLLASTGKPRVILQAHVDTVQPYIPFSEDHERIFGRGACDTKASIATMIVAALGAQRRGITNFGLLFTVEEETSFQGAIESAKFFGDDAPFFVVGEPSLLQPITSHFGIDTFTVTAHGKAAHTSTPEKGVNAIDLLFLAYQKLKKLKLEKGTLATVAQVSGGVAPNIVPAQAHFVFSMRIAPADQTDYLAQIKTLVSPCEVTRGKFLPPVQGQLPANMQFLGKGQTVRYCTELAFLRKGFILGPGDIRFAHTDNEHITKQELAQAVKLFQRILAKF